MADEQTTTTATFGTTPPAATPPVAPPTSLTIELNEHGRPKAIPEPLQQWINSQVAEERRRALAKAGDPLEREQTRQALEELHQLKIEKAEREKRWEDAARLREEAYQRELQARDQRVEEYQGRIASLMGAEIRAAAVAAGAHEDSVSELVELIGGKVGLDENLQPVILNDQDEVLFDEATGQPVPINEYVKFYVETHPHHRSAPPAGGGARGGAFMAGSSNPLQAQYDAAMEAWKKNQTTETYTALMSAKLALRDKAS